MNSEVIAKLVGLLNFQVDMSGLHRFNSGLDATKRKMQQLSAEATKLEKKLNLKLGNGPKVTSQKADASVRHNLNRELQLETAVAKAKRATHAMELAQQKLRFAGHREKAFLTTAAIRIQQASAVADAKSHKAQLERLKVQGQGIKNNATLEAAKLRQTRLEVMLTQQQAKTRIIQQKQLQALSATKRMELALSEARERGLRQAQRFTATQQAAKLRDQRAEVKHQQQTERFNFAASRQAHWEATKNSPRGGADFGLGSFSIALGAAGAALYALTSAASYFNERVKLRQEGASTAESLDTALETAGGKNPLNQKRARESFIELSNKYGQEISVESAKVFSNFVQGQIAIGKTLDQALKIYEDQSAVFRAAALDKEQQKRAAYQLGQIRAKGKPEGSDINDLFDAVGAPVASAIRQAAATRLNFKGEPEQQAGWFKKQVTKGNILAKDFDQGMTNYLGANQDVLAKQMKSIDADQTRSDNQKFMNEAQLNSSQEMKDVIHERIEAERQLNQALQPVNTALAQFDIGLTKLATFMLNFAAGNDADGNKKSEQQQMQERMTTVDTPVDTAMVGTHDYSDVNGNVQRQGGPIGKFWNWLLDVSDHSQGEASKLNVPEKNPFGFAIPSLNLDKLKLDAGDVADGEYRRFRPDVFETLDASSAMKRAQSQSEVSYPVPKQRSPDAPSSTTTTNNITAPVTVNITAKTDASAEDIAKGARAVFDEQLTKTLSHANTALGSEAE